MLDRLTGTSENSFGDRLLMTLRSGLIIGAGMGMNMNPGAGVKPAPRTVVQRNADLPKVPTLYPPAFWQVRDDSHVGHVTEYLSSRVGDFSSKEFFNEIASLNPVIPSHREAMNAMQEAVNIYLPKNYGSQEERLLQALSDTPEGVTPIISQLPKTMGKHDLDGDGNLNRDEALNWWNRSLDNGNPFLVFDLHDALTNKTHSSTARNLREAFDVIKNSNSVSSNKLASVGNLLSKGIESVS